MILQLLNIGKLPGSLTKRHNDYNGFYKNSFWKIFHNFQLIQECLYNPPVLFDTVSSPENMLYLL
jgi:hypothetical protein